MRKDLEIILYFYLLDYCPPGKCLFNIEWDEVLTSFPHRDKMVSILSKKPEETLPRNFINIVNALTVNDAEIILIPAREHEQFPIQFPIDKLIIPGDIIALRVFSSAVRIINTHTYLEKNIHKSIY